MDLGNGKKSRKQNICNNIICKIINIFTQTSNIHFASTHSNERIDFKEVTYESTREWVWDIGVKGDTYLNKQMQPEKGLAWFSNDHVSYMYVHICS